MHLVGRSSTRQHIIWTTISLLIHSHTARCTLWGKVPDSPMPTDEYTFS